MTRPTIRLYRVVETVRLSDRELRSFGPVWEASLELARRAAAALPPSPMRLRLHIEDSAGRTVQRFPDLR